MLSVHKLARTAQCYLPFGRRLKEDAQRLVRQALRRPHERDFAALTHFPRDPLMLDVGANHGQSIDAMLLYRPDATILSFEPNPNLAAMLRDRYAGVENVTVASYGLSERTGHFTLYVPRYRGMVFDGLASFDRNEAADWISERTVYWFDRDRLAVDEMVCQVQALDWVKLDRAPFFIKIDAQGHEYFVLRGAASLLIRQHPVLLLETPGKDDRIDELLRPLGYLEYEYIEGVFLLRPSQGLNSFYMTDERRRQLTVNGAKFA